jgi:NAD(P)-dependent dehydrogenase (short-subunit alcohol dehydrogenase family)
MSTRDLSGSTAVVTGASRGFGRATAIALAERGARVIGVARGETALHELRARLGDTFHPVIADVTDPLLPGRLIARYRPRTLVLNAGAAPPVGSLLEQTWDGFSTNWNVDVRHVFNFTRAALQGPLEPGSVVVSLSSGAALRGSPLSGGYAGAKATITIISSYAALEARRTGSAIRFVAVLPALTPATDLGRVYTQAYAAQAGVSETQLVEGLGGLLATEQAAAGIRDLVVEDTYTAAAYLLTAQGLRPLDPEPAQARS